MVRPRTHTTVLLGYLLLCASACASSLPTQIGKVAQVQTRERIKVVVYPAMVLAGRTLQVTWRIEPEPENREFCIEFEGDLPWRRWCETIPHNRRIWQQQVEPPEGRYTVSLTVTRSDTRTLRTTTTVCVAGMETQCGPQEPAREVEQ